MIVERFARIKSMFHLCQKAAVSPPTLNRTLTRSVNDFSLPVERGYPRPEGVYAQGIEAVSFFAVQGSGKKDTSG
jgi:hypothetical protein